MFIVKEQTISEQAQTTSYTFLMVEISMKIVPARQVRRFFLEIPNFQIKIVYKDLGVNMKGKHDL